MPDIEITDEIVTAAVRADFEHGRLDHPSGQADYDQCCLVVGLRAVAPLIAAQALRQAADEIRSHISAPRARVATDVPLDVAAGIVERRADELERGANRG